MRAPVYAIALLLLAAALCMLLGAHVAQLSYQLDIDGPASARALVGFYDVETGGGKNFRWAQPHASILLTGFDANTVVLDLRLAAARPPDAQPATVGLAAQGRALGTVTLTDHWRRYQALLPASAASDFTIELRSDGYRPHDDPRTLGVTLNDLQIRSIGYSGPSPQRACFLAALVLLACWILWSAGAPPHVAQLGGLALAGVAGWAVADPLASGYWLPTVWWPQWQLVPLLSVATAPSLLRRLRGNGALGPWHGVGLVLILLILLRVGRDVATGLALLAIGGLFFIPRPHQLASEPGAARPTTAAHPPTRDASAAERAPVLNVLTGMRFIAAIIVVAYHYQAYLPSLDFLHTVIALGPSSVSFFFILSGFILIYNYFDWFTADTRRFWAFARLRFARIVPMYLCALLLATPWVLLDVHQLPVTAADSTALDRSWLANLLLIHAFIPLDSVLNQWNPPAWSISAECFFYLLFPFFVRHVLSRFRHTRALLLLMAGLFLVETALYGLSMLGLYWLDPSPERFLSLMFAIIYKFPLLRVWEFLIGCTIGVMFLRNQRRLEEHWLFRALDRHWVRTLIVGSVGALILLIEWAPRRIGWSGNVIDSMRWYVVLTPLFALLILTVACGPTLVTRLLTHPWMVKLGQASYTLYVLHYVTRNLLVRYPSMSGWLLTFTTGLHIAATIGVSLLLYHVVEEPARRLLGGRARRLEPASEPERPVEADLQVGTAIQS